MQLLCLSNEPEPSPVVEYMEAHPDIAAEYLTIEPATLLRRVRKSAIINYETILFYLTNHSVPTNLIVRAVESIRRYHVCRTIVFAPGGAGCADLVTLLADLDVREVVPVYPDTDVAAELDVCLSPEGRSFTAVMQAVATAQIETARSYVRPKLEIPEGVRLHFAVAGAQERTGTTTQAFGMYHALAALGFRPLLVDERRGFLTHLNTMYGDESEVDGCVLTIRGMDFSDVAPLDLEYNAYIHDFGVLDAEVLDDYRYSPVRILCAGCKPWEYAAFAQNRHAFGEEYQTVVFSFATDYDRAAVEDRANGEYRTEFAPYNPDMWTHQNKEWYEEMLLPVLREVVAVCPV